MGLFTKDECAVCGGATSYFSRMKLKDGEWLCGSCIEKAHCTPGFNKSVLLSCTVEEVKERIKQVQKDKETDRKRHEAFKLTSEYSNIMFDDVHKWFAAPVDGRNAKFEDRHIFAYEEIISFELLEDGSAVYSGGLGKAVVGGLLFGTAGAIAGGTSKKATETCTSLQVKIVTTNRDYPSVFINFISSETKTSSITYTIEMESAQNVLSKLSTICKEMEQKKEQIPSFSVADEILKFKNLMDQGIITKEEFEAKKKQLLAL